MSPSRHGGERAIVEASDREIRDAAQFDERNEVELTEDFRDAMDGGIGASLVAESPMFQTATLSVSSSLEEGIWAT